MGVATRFRDGLGKPVSVASETLIRVCAALGAPLSSASQAPEALKAVRAAAKATRLPPVLVAWDGVLQPLRVAVRGRLSAHLHLADGEIITMTRRESFFETARPLPYGYHGLTLELPGRIETATIIAAPVQSYRRPGQHRSWGVGTQLAALRSARSRAVGDLRDLETVCRWVHGRGGDLVTVLPLLPTFNDEPAEPSPYSPVSRLFWSELVLDLGPGKAGAGLVSALDVTLATAEVRDALASMHPDPALLDEELVRYARFRGAQARLGRNWRDWPWQGRDGNPAPEHVDADVERFHLVAQLEVRRQLKALRQRLDASGLRLGLDLAVGVHPDGYDPWSRQQLFCEGMSVGAPPDFGFPSGQDWGFSPVLPAASRREGHKYIAASIGHQASLAGVLRIDHIMAWTRLYWIPHGSGLHQGTYVSYPAEELFAILTLESHRHRCEIVGENLGTVPAEIFEVLPRHRIWGMYLAQFEAPRGEDIEPPGEHDMALIGTHDTPTFAGWIAAEDVADRVKYRLLDPAREQRVREERSAAVAALAAKLGVDPGDRQAFLGALLEWLGRSPSPLVVPWFEDFWLEETGVNLPGTRSSVRPNWQRPIRRLLDDVLNDPQVDALARRLHNARHAP